MDKISVLMSVYNETEEYVHLAINSILNQTYSEIQFIVVLDNPDNDPLKKLLQYYAGIDSRILLLINEVNIGLTRSLNRALQYADGNFIARMDADDISEFDRFERQIEYLLKNKLDFIGGETRWIDETGSVIKEKSNASMPSDCLEEWLMYEDCLAHPTWLVKKEVFDMLNGYKEIRACEDYNFVLRARNKKVKFGICDSIVLNYRINSNGISKNNVLRQVLSSYYMQKRIDMINELNDEDIQKYLEDRRLDCYSQRYIDSMEILKTGIKRIKQKDPRFVISFVKALLKCKYVFINMRMIVKLNLLMKKYQS